MKPFPSPLLLLKLQLRKNTSSSAIRNSGLRRISNTSPFYTDGLLFPLQSSKCNDTSVHTAVILCLLLGFVESLEQSCCGFNICKILPNSGSTLCKINSSSSTERHQSEDKTIIAFLRAPTVITVTSRFHSTSPHGSKQTRSGLRFRNDLFCFINNVLWTLHTIHSSIKNAISTLESHFRHFLKFLFWLLAEK